MIERHKLNRKDLEFFRKRLNDFLEQSRGMTISVKQYEDMLTSIKEVFLPAIQKDRQYLRDKKK